MFRNKKTKYNVGGRIFVTYSTAIEYARVNGLTVEIIK